MDEVTNENQDRASGQTEAFWNDVFNDFDPGGEVVEPEQASDSFWNDVFANGNLSSVEQKVEANPEVASQLPSNPVLQQAAQPLVQEARQIGDGDARTDEVANKAVEKSLNFWNDVFDGLVDEVKPKGNYKDLKDQYSGLPVDSNLPALYEPPLEYEIWDEIADEIEAEAEAEAEVKKKYGPLLKSLQIKNPVENSVENSVENLESAPVTATLNNPEVNTTFSGSKALNNTGNGIASGVSTTKPVFSGSTGGRVHFGAYGSGSFPKRKSIAQHGGYGGTKPVARNSVDFEASSTNTGMKGQHFVASGMTSGSVAKSKQFSVKRLQLHGSEGHTHNKTIKGSTVGKAEATTIEVLKNALMQDSKTWPEMNGVKRTTKYSPFVLSLKNNEIYVNKERIENITPEEQLLLQKSVFRR